MLCPNCGATLTEQDTKCPYCGTPNPAGAEKKYMNQLSDLRKQMEGLEKESHKAYKKELHRSSRFILRTCLILVGILAAITILFQVSEFISRQKSRAYTESKLAFEREYYPILNDLYAKGDDAATYDYYMSLYEKDGSDALFRWKHYSYFNAYDSYYELQSLKIEWEAGTCDEALITSTLYYGLNLLQPDSYTEKDLASFTEEELQKYENYQAETRQIFQKYLHISEEEIAQVANDCSDSDYAFLSYSRCQVYARELIKNL